MLRRLIQLYALLMVTGRVVAGTTAPAGATAAQTHTLFMGADLAIMTKGGALPVCDVQSNSFVVNGPDGRVVVPASDDRFKLKILESLKLTAVRLNLDKLQFERVYSLGNDPMAKFQDAARTSAYMASAVDASDAAIRAGQNSLGVAQGGLAALPADTAPEARAPFEAQIASAQSNLAQVEAAAAAAQSMDRMDAFSAVSNSNKLSHELSAERYDALNVTFELSTPRPLDQPYLVITMRYFEQKDRRDSVRTWVYAERLPLLDEHPRQFTIRRAGFSPGYHIDSYQVHVYDGLQELATTVSRKQVPLTTEEAFEYAVIEYVGSNRNQTKPPARAKAFWPAALSTRLSPDALNRTLHVQVGRDGRALGLYEDAACSHPLADQALADLAGELRFFPALDQGKPIVGVCPVKLGRLN